MSVQTERHEEAMRLWRVLENLGEDERASRLESDDPEVYSASDFYSTPCSAMLATLVFKRLGVHNEDREVFWLKLYLRPVGNVWKFYEEAKRRGPEQFAGLIGAFAKKVKPLEEVG